MDSTESEARELLDRQSEAMRLKDLDRLISRYSPDVVYFDVVPPLQYVRSAALRRRFSEWFDGFTSAMHMDVRDLRVMTGGDIAVACWLSRVRGTLKSGQEVGSWVRATSCSQRSPHDWLITHEHVSWPVDARNGSAAMDLVP